MQVRNTQFTEHSKHACHVCSSSRMYKVFNNIFNFWFKKISLLLASFVNVLKVSFCITTWLLTEVAVLLMHLPFWSTACWKLLNLKALDLQTDNAYDLFQTWGYYITPSQHLPMDHIICASTTLSYSFYQNWKPRITTQHRQGFTSTTSTPAFPLNAMLFIPLVAVVSNG